MKFVKFLVKKYKNFMKKYKKEVKFVIKVLVFLKALLEVVDVLLKLWELMGPWLVAHLNLLMIALSEVGRYLIQTCRVLEKEDSNFLCPELQRI